MKSFWKGFWVAVAAGGAALGLAFLLPHLAARLDRSGILASADAPIAVPQKTREELIAEALEKSSKIKALYMTADVANNAGAARIRAHIVELAKKTEINGIVIDAKEACGPDYNETRLKNLVRDLHDKNIWAIARIVAFKDASQRVSHPEWYVTRKAAAPAPDGCPNKQHLTVKNRTAELQHQILWQDVKGGY